MPGSTESGSTLPDETLSTWRDDGYDGYDGYDGFDGLDEATWDDYPSQTPPAPHRTAPPWYRSPRLLLVLIGLAAAVLVVATALLMTGRQSGEIPATPRLESRTSAELSPTPASATQTRTPTSTTAPSTTEQSTEESTEPEVTAEPAEPLPPAPASAAPPASQSRSPEGPRINVTRTPMSFTPGKVG